jgi:hypothetical protein
MRFLLKNLNFLSRQIYFQAENFWQPNNYWIIQNYYYPKI